MTLPIAVLLFAWTLSGSTPEEKCALDTMETGFSLRCEQDVRGTFSTVSTHADAEEYRMQRVTLTGELQTRGVEGGASFWIQAYGDQTMLLSDDGSSDILRGDIGWTRRSLTMPVPANATKLVYGVRLRGGGSVELRNFSFDSSPIDAGKPPSGPARDILDTAIRIVRENALRAPEVDWKSVLPQVRALAAGAEKTSDVYPAIRLLLMALGDRHSYLQPAAAKRTAETRKNEPVEARLQEPGIGYVKIPAYMSAPRAAMESHVRNAYASLGAIEPAAPCGWIVDLRTNTGGNIAPMFAALRPFLGEGVVGSISGRTAPAIWRADAFVKVTPPRPLRKLEQARVAVLTSRSTASAGEAVTVTFRGRSNTRTFGTPTAGVSTANTPFRLRDGATIILTTAIYLDRTGKRYGDAIEPDEPAEDALAAAVAWLRTGCEAERGN